MPANPRPGVVYPASAAQVAEGLDNRYAVTSLAAKGRLWAHGECRLIKDGGNLRLARVGMGRQVLGGKLYQVPVAGVALPPTGLAVDTLHYIYHFDNAGVQALVASTLGYVVDATLGIPVRSDNPAYSLVGMARTVAGPAWADAVSQRYVLSYFNRRRREMRAALTADRAVAGASYAEITTAAERLAFLAWGDEPVVLGITATGQGGVGTTALAAGVWMDGAMVPTVAVAGAASSGTVVALSVAAQGFALAEGAHVAGIGGLYVGGAGTLRGASAPPSSITGWVMG